MGFCTGLGKKVTLTSSLTGITALILIAYCYRLSTSSDVGVSRRSVQQKSDSLSQQLAAFTDDVSV